MTKSPWAKDEVGNRYSRLVVLRRSVEKSKHRSALWDCLCDCGNETTVSGSSMRKGETKSCGCRAQEALKAGQDIVRTHGRSTDPVYQVWTAMWARCRNPKNKRYPHYGGRGIKVCERWQSFEMFILDMGERPNRLTLERKDVDGDYEPGNCVWASYKDQSRNTTKNHVVTYQGKTRCLTDWAAEYGLPANVFGGRLRLGWPIEKALNTPVKRPAATLEN